MPKQEKVEKPPTPKELEGMIKGKITRKKRYAAGYSEDGKCVIISQHYGIVLHHMLTNHPK